MKRAHTSLRTLSGFSWNEVSFIERRPAVLKDSLKCCHCSQSLLRNESAISVILIFCRKIVISQPTFPCLCLKSCVAFLFCDFDVLCSKMAVTSEAFWLWSIRRLLSPFREVWRWIWRARETAVDSSGYNFCHNEKACATVEVLVPGTRF